MATPTAECVEALREAADRLGKSPTKAEYEALDLTPSSTTICRVVGGWNEAKELANLYAFGQNENGGRDVSPKPDGVVVPSGRDWEELTAQQRWYYKNRRHRIQTKESRRRELREWFTELKRDRFECGRCHEARPEALDFHHPDRKHEGVSQMVNHGYSKERIRGEMDRRTVLCANCHRREHYDGPDATRIPDLDGSKHASSLPTSPDSVGPDTFGYWPTNATAMVASSARRRIQCVSIFTIRTRNAMAWRRWYRGGARSNRFGGR